MERKCTNQEGLKFGMLTCVVKLNTPGVELNVLLDTKAKAKESRSMLGAHKKIFSNVSE